MSLVAMGWAWEQEVSSGAKLVLLALADRANEDDGTCWPGLKTVARKVGLSERVVRKHIESLEVDGLLRREVRTRGDGSQTSNLIVLSMTGGAVTGDRGGRSPMTARTEPTGETTSSPKVKKERASAQTEHPDFAEWLGNHQIVTGIPVLKAGSAGRRKIAGMFGARREEGLSLDDLKAATRGAFNDPYRRERGYFDPESVLRPTKVAKLVMLGRRLAVADAERSVDAVDWSRFDA